MRYGMVMMNAWMDGCLYGIPSETKKLESLKSAYSGESVHLFRRKASTCSEDNRPGVPGETVRYYRSVATLVFSIFQSSRSLSSLNAAFS